MTPTPVTCRVCGKDVTAEARSALDERQYGGFNMMNIASATPWPEVQQRAFFESFRCRRCAAGPGGT